MNLSQTGQFYGQTNQTLRLGGITLTDTVYTLDKVDWHYHENAYFTFILQGEVIEGNKKEIYHCGAGSLLFHNWQEPHYNIKPEGFTRGFHVEIERNWFDDFDFNDNLLQGSNAIGNPSLKLLLYKLFIETKANDSFSKLSITMLLLETLTLMTEQHTKTTAKNPLWVIRLKEVLHDRFADPLSLGYLSSELQIHPVHLSRDFSKYFGCSLGDYIRKLKITQSLHLISQNNQDLTSVAFDCGFADQSHFARCFKATNGISPSAYRKMLLR